MVGRPLTPKGAGIKGATSRVTVWLPDEAIEHLREVLASYDDALTRITEGPKADGSRS